MTLLFLIFYLFNFDFVLIHRFLYLQFLFCFVLFLVFHFYSFFSVLILIFFFWSGLVEMLPMPNPFVPEEHEPWCPYSLVQLNCMIAMSLHIFEPFFSMHVVIFYGLSYFCVLLFCIFRRYSAPRTVSLLQLPKRYIITWSMSDIVLYIIWKT